MIPILANSEVQERLVKYLPDGESLPKTEQELRDTVQSPQFQQVWMEWLYNENTVKPVYKGHSMEPEKVVLWALNIYRLKWYALFINGRNETCLYRQWFVI